MNRDELTALRDLIDLVLRLPDAMRSEIAAWLTPEAAQRPGNGLDAHPPPQAAPTAHAGKARRGRPPASAKPAEQRLLEELQERPLTAGELSRAGAGALSTIKLRLKRMGELGLITKDVNNRWRIAGEEADATGEEPRPQPGPA